MQRLCPPPHADQRPLTRFSDVRTCRDWIFAVTPQPSVRLLMWHTSGVAFHSILLGEYLPEDINFITLAVARDLLAVALCDDRHRIWVVSLDRYFEACPRGMDWELLKERHRCTEGVGVMGQTSKLYQELTVYPEAFGLRAQEGKRQSEPGMRPAYPTASVMDCLVEGVPTYGISLPGGAYGIGDHFLDNADARGGEDDRTVGMTAGNFSRDLGAPPQDGGVTRCMPFAWHERILQTRDEWLEVDRPRAFLPIGSRGASLAAAGPILPKHVLTGFSVPAQHRLGDDDLNYNLCAAVHRHAQREYQNRLPPWLVSISLPRRAKRFNPPQLGSNGVDTEDSSGSDLVTDDRDQDGSDTCDDDGSLEERHQRASLEALRQELQRGGIKGSHPKRARRRVRPGHIELAVASSHVFCEIWKSTTGSASGVESKPPDQGPWRLVVIPRAGCEGRSWIGGGSEDDLSSALSDSVAAAAAAEEEAGFPSPAMDEVVAFGSRNAWRSLLTQNHIWYLLSQGCSLHVLLLSQSPVRVVTNLLIFENRAKAAALCALNGWDAKQLPLLTLFLGLRFRELDEIRQSLGLLRPDQEMQGCQMVMDFIHSGYSCATMVPSFSPPQQSASLEPKILTELPAVADVPQLPSDRSFVSRLLEQAMQFVTRLVLALSMWWESLARLEVQIARARPCRPPELVMDLSISDGLVAVFQRGSIFYSIITEALADCDAGGRQNAVENFDFSRVSFAQPVAEGDHFEDAFYPDSGYDDLAEGSDAAGADGDLDPASNGSCCGLEGDAALRLCANKTSPLTPAGNPPLALAVSHAPRWLRNGALTAAVNAMWCAERGYPFILDQRNVHPSSATSQVIPHWLEKCQQESIKWMLWLDSDTILVGQNASLDFVADVLAKVDDRIQILLVTHNASDIQHGIASAASFGMIFIQCSDWARALVDKVRDDGFDQGTPDEEVFREAFLSDALEARRHIIQLPPQATNAMSLFSMAEPQPVVHLAELPSSIRNHTFSAALRAHCDRMTGLGLNLSSLQHAYENSLFLAANKDFREAGTSRWAFLLAKRLRLRGRMQEAEDLLRWAADGLQAELGEHKLDTLFGKVVLAKFLADQDRVSEARPLFQDAVTAGLKSLGAHNPVMLDWQERLALLLRREGLQQEAAGMLRQVIRGRRRWREEARVKAAALQLHEILLPSSGPTAPSPEQLIEEIMSNFPDAADNVARQRLVKANEKSSKLSGEGNLNQAEWVLKRALEKSTLVLPVADPDLLVSRLNLGALRQRMAKPEALLDLEEVFQAQVSMMGPDHPDTQATIQAINGLEGWQGQYNLHARYQGALSKLASANNRFAKQTKATQSKSDRTVQSFEAAIRRGERKLGKQNHGVLKAKFNLAVGWAVQDRHAEAFALWRGVLQDQLQHIGPFSSDTLATQRHILSWIYQDE
ncbi:unnamed protein product [Symbiodinium natans]|uniref:Uncharacterized protein n=1 Tax=Symbiodinium natans TaxID=878477 RepID=A0A812KXS0_9DINO|nr:unnamed protein product [Symbiodinium natans]